MQNRTFNCTAFCLTLVVTWVAIAAIELTIWWAGGSFPPGPIMSMTHTALATLTLVYAVFRALHALEDQVGSTEKSFELGRKVGAVAGQKPDLRVAE